MKKEVPGWVDKVDPCEANCPSRDVLDLIGDRWSLLLLLVIAQGVHRNGELKRRVGGISQKMLTQTLRALEANGLVERRDFQTVPPHVEYELTAMGQEAATRVYALLGWIEDAYWLDLGNPLAFARGSRDIVTGAAPAGALSVQPTGAALVPFFLKGVGDDPDTLRWFQNDRIHPNEAAQPRLLANVWPELKKLMP